MCWAQSVLYILIVVDLQLKAIVPCNHLGGRLPSAAIEAFTALPTLGKGIQI